MNKGEDAASTDTGYPNLSALKAGCKTWQPMSPKAPVPKSHQPRQFQGWYILLNGLIRAGPINKSQSNVAGILCALVGVSNPCGHIGRLVATSTFFTSPISPFHIHSHTQSTSSPEAPWFPICVAILYSEANRESNLDS